MLYLFWDKGSIYEFPLVHFFLNSGFLYFCVMLFVKKVIYFSCYILTSLISIICHIKLNLQIPRKQEKKHRFPIETTWINTSHLHKYVLWSCINIYSLKLKILEISAELKFGLRWYGWISADRCNHTLWRGSYWPQ